MKTITTKCIILGHKDLPENDKLIFLYSEELGKIKAIAKGARKITSKFTGHLETLTFCTVSLYFGPKNIILQEIATEKNYFRSRKNLRTISNALKIAEITNQMLYENQKMEDLPELIKETLSTLRKTRKKSLIKTAYTIKLLDKAGIVPDFKSTPLTIEQKYAKFFNFIKNKPLKEIEKISLTKEEKRNIQNFTKKLLTF